MRPKPRSRMPASARSISAIGPSISSRWASCHCSRVNSSGSPPGGPPVLVTSTASGPRSASTLVQQGRGGVEIGHVVHVGAGRAHLGGRAPRCSPASASSRPPARPRRTSARATARPIPWDAPVTSATLPSSPRSIGAAYLRSSGRRCTLAPACRFRLLVRAAPLVLRRVAAALWLRRREPERLALPAPPRPRGTRFARRSGAPGRHRDGGRRPAGRGRARRLSAAICLDSGLKAAKNLPSLPSSRRRESGGPNRSPGFRGESQFQLTA